MEDQNQQEQAQVDDKPVNPEVPQLDADDAQKAMADEAEENKPSEPAAAAGAAANPNDFSFSSDEENKDGGHRKKKAAERKDDWDRKSDADKQAGDEAEREREKSRSQERPKDRAERRRGSEEKSDEGRNGRHDDDADQGYGGDTRGSQRRERDRGGRRGGDWDSGRSHRDRGSQRVRVPSFKAPQMTLREFENYQDGRFQRYEIREAYNDYLALYAKEATYTFYRTHRNYPWFIERYDPCEVYKQKVVLKKYCQYQSTQFRQVVIDKMLAEPTSDYFKLSLTQQGSYDYNALVDGQGREIELQKAPHYAFDTDLLTLYLKYLPLEVKRLDLKELLEQKLAGFVHLSLSEPMRNHQWSRLAWASFATAADCEAALQKIPELQIGDNQLAAVKSQPSRKRAPVRICPPLPEQQITYDYELCKMLIEKVFDPEKDIETWVVAAVESLVAPPPSAQTDAPVEPPAEKQATEPEATAAPEEKKQDEEQVAAEGGETEMAPAEEAKEPAASTEQQQPDKAESDGKISTALKLDLLILYLRRVHAFCLYCGEEYEDERMLSTRCGPQHIRNETQMPAADFEKIMDSEELKSQQRKEIEGTDKDAGDETPEKALMSHLNKIAGIQSCSSGNLAWRGSLNFLSKYVDMALKRIAAGPRKLVNPEQAFADQDLEEFCRSRVQEEDKGRKYSCKFCKKNFMGEHYVINHIKNRHQDQIDQVYARESTQQWLKDTLKKEMKKEMKDNYYKDDNKYFDRPGRRYHSNESSYAHRDSEGDRNGSGGDRRGPRNGGQNRPRQFSQRDDYVDYDDPEVNANMQKQKEREQPDYSDLFG